MIIGLRPGEKLYEELLLGDSPKGTSHPKIQKINDPFIPFNILSEELKNLKNLINENKANDVKNLLIKLLKLYKSSSKIVDHIHVQETSTKDYLQKQHETNDSKVIKIR